MEGGNAGIMGKISNSCFRNGGEVIGIMPKNLMIKEKVNYQVSKTIITKDMSERKKKLFNMGDAFLVLPGGSGTIEEATEIISWKILGIHEKDIIIYNINNYWDPLIKMYEVAKNKNFGNKNLQNICKHVQSYKEFIKIFP